MDTPFALCQFLSDVKILLLSSVRISRHRIQLLCLPYLWIHAKGMAVNHQIFELYWTFQHAQLSSCKILHKSIHSSLFNTCSLYSLSSTLFTWPYFGIKHQSQFNPYSSWQSVKRKKENFTETTKHTHDTHNGESVYKQWNSCEFIYRVWVAVSTGTPFLRFISLSLLLSISFTFFYYIIHIMYVIRNHKQLLSTFLYFYFYDPGMSYTHFCSLSHPDTHTDATPFIYSFIWLPLIPLAFVCRTSPFTVHRSFCLRFLFRWKKNVLMIRSNAP